MRQKRKKKKKSNRNKGISKINEQIQFDRFKYLAAGPRDKFRWEISKPGTVNVSPLCFAHPLIFAVVLVVLLRIVNVPRRSLCE